MSEAPRRLTRRAGHAAHEPSVEIGLRSLASEVRMALRRDPAADPEELESAGLEGVALACQTYRPESGEYFSMHARRCIAPFLRRSSTEQQQQARHEVPLGEVCLATDDTSAGVLDRVLCAEILAVAPLEERPETRLRKWRQRRTFLDWRYDAQETYREIAERLGVSLERARQLDAEAVRIMRMATWNRLDLNDWATGETLTERRARRKVVEAAAREAEAAASEAAAAARQQAAQAAEAERVVMEQALTRENRIVELAYRLATEVLGMRGDDEPETA